MIKLKKLHNQCLYIWIYAITEKEVGSYDVAYASVKKQKKNTSLVSSGWSENYSKTKTTSVLNL